MNAYQWDWIDQYRRSLGEVLDAMGLGPSETPFRVVQSQPALTLRAYGQVDNAEPVVLLVPAPIKRAYIWDLAPWASVVRQMLRSRLRVYLIQWECPGAKERSFGLAEYAHALILDCLRAIGRETGQRRVFLAGHSFGGTLAAIFAALHPDRVRGLMLLGAPLHFGPGVGAFGVVSLASSNEHLPTDPENAPGSWLDVVSYLADPLTFGWSRWMDWFASLPDPRALQTHIQVERWSLDEVPLAGRLYREILEKLYREDRLMRGTLSVAGQRVAAEFIGAPLLTVVFSRCSVAPPASVIPFYEAVKSTEKRLLWYHGDTGVALQHVGMLVGRSAHRHLWPQILRWMRRQ